MTTLCADGRTVAADSLICDGERISRRDGRKIIVEGHVIYALVGLCCIHRPLIAWVRNGAVAEQMPKTPPYEWALLVIDKDGPRQYLHNLSYPETVTYPYTAGSGAVIALGAMLAGKTPRQAVEIAATRDPFTGGDIQVVDIAKALGLAPPPEEQTYVPHPTKPDKMLVRQPKRERAA